MCLFKETRQIEESLQIIQCKWDECGQNDASSYQTGRTWSMLQVEPLYCRIFVTAEIAFSVGLMFSDKTTQILAWVILQLSVLWIRDILLLRICGSVPLTYRSESCSSRQWLSRCQQKIFYFSMFFTYYFLEVHLHYSSKIKKSCIQMSQNSKNQDFSYYFCLIWTSIDGSGSGTSKKIHNTFKIVNLSLVRTGTKSRTYAIRGKIFIHPIFISNTV
jgi:hypothetical protein